MVWPALIAAAGSIGGGMLANKGKPKPGDALFNPGIQSSQLYQQMQLMAMLGLGQQISPQMLNAGSPLSTLLGSAQSIGLKQKGANAFSKVLPDLQRIISQGKAAGKTAAEIKADLQALPFWGADKGGGGALEGLIPAGGDFDPLGLGDKGKLPDKERGRRVMRRLMAASGYNSLDDLIQAELDYETNNAGKADQYNQTSNAVEKGRLDALSKIAQLQSGFVAPSQDEILAQAKTVEDAYRGQVSRERADSELALLTQAQQLGINPGGRLARLDEWQAQKNLEAQPEGLARALQLLSGQQGLQSNALGSLQTSLSAAEQTPLSLMQTQSGNQVGLGQIAANQAMSLADLQQRGNTSMANGVAGGASAIADWLAAQQFNNNGGGLDGGQAAAPFNSSRSASPSWMSDY